MSDSVLERRVRVVVAAFGDSERGRVWRERLGAAPYRIATETLIDALALGLGRDFEDLDAQGVAELLSLHLPGRLGDRETWAGDLPDLLEDFLSLAAEETGLSPRTWEWISAVGEARGDFEAALADAGRPRFAGRPAEPDRRPGRKIGRNEPCPCGSGKKYKSCCQRLL
jgi:SEC-C motif-containing protein